MDKEAKIGEYLDQGFDLETAVALYESELSAQQQQDLGSTGSKRKHRPSRDDEHGDRNKKRRKMEIDEVELDGEDEEGVYIDEDGVRAPIPDRKAEAMLDGDFFQDRFSPKTLVVTPFNIVENLRGNVKQNPTTKSQKVSLYQIFSPPADILRDLPFDELLVAARTEKKWLMVNLLGIKSEYFFDSIRLNRDLWKDEALKKMMAPSFIFAQLCEQSPEGDRFISRYKPRAIPSIYFIDPRTGASKLTIHEIPNTFVAADLKRHIELFLRDNNLGHTNHFQSELRIKAQQQFNESSDEEVLPISYEDDDLQRLKNENEELFGDEDDADDYDSSSAQEKTKIENSQQEESVAPKINLDGLTVSASGTVDSSQADFCIRIKSAGGKFITGSFRGSDTVAHLYKFAINFQEGGDQPFSLNLYPSICLSLSDQPLSSILKSSRETLFMLPE